jgi:hypothetical protein
VSQCDPKTFFSSFFSDDALFVSDRGFVMIH